MTGEMNWFGQSTYPDLCYTSLDIAKRNNLASILELWQIKTILKKTIKKYSKINFCKIVLKEDLQLVIIRDAFYKSDKSLLTEYCCYQWIEP